MSAAESLTSPADYLAQERLAETKSEFYAGRVYAMSGGSRGHSLIAVNLIRELSRELRGATCETHDNDMRVKVNETGLYSYPDVSVVCGDPEFEDGQLDTLLNPVLIIEVLSPSTEAHDRGFKASQYRNTPSLKEYVLVAQDRPSVEVQERQGNVWELREYSQPGQEVALLGGSVRIPLEEIYERVSFAESPPR